MNSFSPSWIRAAVSYLMLAGVLSMAAHSDQYSEAITFEVHTTNPTCPECTIISVVGVIHTTTADEFRDFLRNHSVPSGTLVDFDSPGGSLVGGTELVIDKLAAAPMNIALPKQELGKAGVYLIAECEHHRR